MADKSFGIKELNLIGASGTPTITSPNNLNLNASNVAISTDVTIGRHLDVDGHAEFDNVNIAGVTTFSSAINVSSSYGTSGQVLTSQGSGSAPQWTTLTDTGATWTTLSAQSLASSGAVSVTGIPSTATRVMVSFTNVTTATNNEWGIRAGTSSGLASSGYDTIAGYWGGSNGGTQINDRWACYGSASTSFDWNGQIIIYKMSGNLWQGFAWYHYNSGGTSRFAHGEVSLGGTLDRIGFTGLGANFNSGTIYPSYMEP